MDDIVTNAIDRNCVVTGNYKNIDYSKIQSCINDIRQYQNSITDKSHYQQFNYAIDILTDEEIANLVDEIMNIPVEKNNNCLSTYGSVNVDDLINVTKKNKKIPTVDKLLKENKQLKEQLEKYQIQNFNLREDKIIKKMSFPNEEIKDKSLLELYSMPSYEDLKNENQKLKEDILFCLKSIKQEMEMSTDSRTKQEMLSCYQILKEWSDK